MAIYQTYEEDGVEKAEYNFTYVDLVFDDYRSVGLRILGQTIYQLINDNYIRWKGDLQNGFASD